VVVGGSGFMSQTPYTIQLATPYRGPHRVTAFFGPSPGGRAQSVTFHMRPGEHAEVQADGTVRVRPQSPGAPVPPPPRRAEPGVFRRGDLSFHLGGAAAPDPPHSLPFGIAGDVPLAGDWNGDGITTIGIYRPSESAFYLSDDNTSGLPAYAFPFELPGAPACKVPIVGDWHGSGIDTIGFYVPEESTFYLVTAHGSAAGAAVVRFGAPGDVPVIGDWDGNGTSNIGVYRPAERRFLLRNCNSEGEADLDFVYGMPGDQPVAGDADGDGIDTVGVYRPAESTFYLRSRNAAGSPDLVWTFGASGDVPLLGAWWP
jgi:ribosomal protein S16